MITDTINKLNEYKGDTLSPYHKFYKGKYKIKWYHKIFKILYK